MSKKNLALTVAPAALSLLLALGVTTVFTACDRREDGTWMHCHQCQNRSLREGSPSSPSSVLPLS